MKLKLIYVQTGSDGTQRIIKEELLEEASDEPMSKRQATEIILRSRPGLRPLLVRATDFPADWLVQVDPRESNGVRIYASISP